MAQTVAAAAAFEETLEELGLDDPDEIGEAAAFGRRAALVAAADVLWRRHLGPLLDSRQVQTLMGVGTRQAVSDLARRDRLLALPAGGGRVAFPAFQFGPSGRPYPNLRAVVAQLRAAGADAHTAASWLMTPKELLGGGSPVEWMRAGGASAPLLEAARRTGSRLSR